MKKTVSINLKGKPFTFNFPNMGHLIDAESNKAYLSKGKYSFIATNLTESSERMLDFIDGVSYFLAILGEPFMNLFGCSDINGFLELEIGDVEEIISEYKKKYRPFHEQVEKMNGRISPNKPVEAEEPEALDGSQS